MPKRPWPSTWSPASNASHGSSPAAPRHERTPSVQPMHPRRQGRKPPLQTVPFVPRVWSLRSEGTLRLRVPQQMSGLWDSRTARSTNRAASRAVVPTGAVEASSQGPPSVVRPPRARLDPSDPVHSNQTAFNAKPSKDTPGRIWNRHPRFVRHGDVITPDQQRTTRPPHQPQSPPDRETVSPADSRAPINLRPHRATSPNHRFPLPTAGTTHKRKLRRPAFGDPVPCQQVTQGDEDCRLHHVDRPASTSVPLSTVSTTPWRRLIKVRRRSTPTTKSPEVFVINADGVGKDNTAVTMSSHPYSHSNEVDDGRCSIHGCATVLSMSAEETVTSFSHYIDTRLATLEGFLAAPLNSTASTEFAQFAKSQSVQGDALLNRWATFIADEFVRLPTVVSDVRRLFETRRWKHNVAASGPGIFKDFIIRTLEQRGHTGVQIVQISDDNLPVSRLHHDDG